MANKFVSSAEHAYYPFFGVQFHPEKPMFIWKEDLDIPHSFDAQKFSQDLMNNFVTEWRKNFNSFESGKIEHKLVIENAALKLTSTSSQDIYLFEPL